MDLGHRTLDRRRRRPGVVLLIVISLLALFILLGVTFTLSVNQYHYASKLELKVQQVGDQPHTETDIVLGQLLYDSAAKNTLQYHSLLRDLYGSDAFRGTVQQVRATPYTGPSGANAAGTPDTQFYSIRFSTTATLSTIPNYYAGRVITFTNGPAANHSSRIVAYAPIGGTPIDSNLDTTTNPHFIIEAIESKLSGSVTNLIALNNEFIINGAPFNGTGAGYETTSRNIGLQYEPPDPVTPGNYLSGNNVALLPNIAGLNLTTGRLQPNLAIDFGGMDESWDAPDFQNMFLAMVPPRAAESYLTPPRLPIIPSFHRPELVNFWRNNLPTELTATFDPMTDAASKNFARTIVLRPMPWDHPNFSGSNPAFDRSQGTAQLLDNLINRNNRPIWDVDNDSDGVPDSIWIDPGLPVITSPDGRRYKRLAAILVKDLDGSINVNAHGNLQQIASANHRAETALTTNMVTGYAPPSAALGLAASGQFLPRGSGFGPAEVSFLNIFSNDTVAYGNILRRRYDSNTANDSGTTAAPGRANYRDDLSAVKHYGVPNDYHDMAGVGATWYDQPTWYASPPDVWGRGAVVLDYGGQPIYAMMGQNNEMLDSPYEMSLSGETNNTDTPYTVAELELLLRYHDPDASQLPLRLLLAPYNGTSNVLTTDSPGVVSSAGSHHIRNMLTTHSSFVPAPTTRAPREMRALPSLSMGSTSILDLYRAKLVAGLSSNPELAMQFIVPWEFYKGQKFDINRWLGDGIDNATANRTRDEPNEGAGSEPAWQSEGGVTVPTSFATPSVDGQHTNATDFDGGGLSFSDNQYARQLYARHLFCLAMLFLPDSFPNGPCPHETTITGVNYRRLVVQRIAQWAVNCVDFRDHDAVMTPFEFDYFPFADNGTPPNGNTWNVDGIVGATPGPDGILGNGDDVLSPDDAAAYRGLVWGMETPDLLITETLAFHDRRVRDTDADTTTPRRKRIDSPADDDLDQYRVPQGSLFVELYCPRAVQWSSVGQNLNQKPKVPSELYDNNNQLVLGLTAPGGRPVWRLAISRINGGDAAKSALATAGTIPESASFDPSEVNLLGASAPGGAPTGSLTIERYVWFGNATPPAAELPYTFHNTLSDPRLMPGGYALVGPRAVTNLGSVTSAGAWAGASSQRIELKLTPNVGMGERHVEVYDAAGTLSAKIPSTDIREALPIIADTVLPSDWPAPQPFRVGLNVTEPLPLSTVAGGNYYPPPDPSLMLPASVPKDFYDDPNAPLNLFPDGPLDSPGPLSGQNTSQRPIAVNNMSHTGSYPDSASVFLQRLANPTQAFDQLKNPYITVDWASIDVTVFSGEEDPDQAMPVPFDTDDVAAGRPAVRFRTRERGFIPASSTATFWPPLTVMPATTPQAGTGNYFKYSLSDTAHTFPYLNSIAGVPTTSAATYYGEPLNPFPWVAHLNRPFSNPMELLQVPSSSPARLGTEVSPGPLDTTSLGPDPFDVTALNKDKAFRTPFLHLLNFFNSSGTINDAAHLYRILDYVEVPSPYQGAERWYNPQNFGAVNAYYRPPFNKLSRFRDPGRINVNTIFDKDVWDAAIARFPNLDTTTFWDALTQSRKGGTTAWTSMENSLPTLFGNPFRAADSADLMPITPGPTNMRKTNAVEATLLRPTDPTASPQRPLFDQTSTQSYNHTTRNSYFRYQGLQKLGNTLSTQSNCFAVWITIGYFEVEDNTLTPRIDAAHPDGFALSQEVGADSGEVTRHRAFYIIDRSIPVGFSPGSKLNTEDCVLIRRLIE